MYEMNFYVIENDPYRAIYFENVGIDYIFIDLEKKGKLERQANIDSVKSNHSISDISSVKKVLKSSKVLVRIDPINSSTKEQIESVLDEGADAVMLPYFMKADHVEYFINTVKGRAETILLVEHFEPLINLRRILSVGGIDKVHFGLNDLSISLGYDFMFKILGNELLNEAVLICKDNFIKFGIGGVGPAYSGRLPGVNILNEYKRLGATATIISRSLTNILYQGNKALFESELNKILQIAKEPLPSSELLLENLKVIKTIV